VECWKDSWKFAHVECTQAQLARVGVGDETVECGEKSRIGYAHSAASSGVLSELMIDVANAKSVQRRGCGHSPFGVIFGFLER